MAEMLKPRSLLVNFDGEPFPSLRVTARDVEREAWRNLAGAIHKFSVEANKTNAQWEAEMRVSALRQSAGIKPATTTIRIGLPKRYRESF